MKKAAKMALMVTLELTGGLAVGYLASQVYDKINGDIQLKDNREKFEGLEDYMNKTADGRILTLQYSKNPISVSISNFSDEEKQQVIDAVNRLDNIIDNIDYTIIDTPSSKLDAKIRITKDVIESESGPGVAGVASYSYNHNAKIVYPINITINENSFLNSEQYPFASPDFIDSLNEKLLNRIVKHELMHTLGFADLRDEKEKMETVMYYNVAGYDKINDYTDRDVYNIKRVYDDILVDTYYPKYMQVYYKGNEMIEEENDESQLTQ